jgi:tetratricopeptide (TPR) repeat protein
MPPKKSKPIFVPEELPKPLPKEEAKAELEAFFKRLESEFKDTPKELVEFGADKVKDFIKGNISWAEMFNVPKKMIRDMVEYGYLQFQTGRYEEAERFFKMLTILDWNNGYYHSMMGSILQRQKRYGEAVAEYSEAIKLNPQDAVSLTNRGEIYLQHKKIDKAMADFNGAIALDPKKENKWANRARLLKGKIEQVAAMNKKAVEDAAKKEKGKEKKGKKK